MARKLRVFGVNYDGRTRRIVAAYSQKQAAERLKVSVQQLRNYGSETGTPTEVELAMRTPGAVWSLGYRMGSEWELVSMPPDDGGNASHDDV